MYWLIICDTVTLIQKKYNYKLITFVLFHTSYYILKQCNIWQTLNLSAVELLQQIVVRRIKYKRKFISHFKSGALKACFVFVYLFKQ